MEKVVHDKKEMRFFLPLDEGEAYVRYSMKDDHTMDLHKTFTSPSLRGQGMAAKVVQGALDYAEKNKLKIIPSCPYVKSYIERKGDKK